MCQQHTETLIAVTELSLQVREVIKNQKDMGNRIEVLEESVLGNGHPPLEETVAELAIVVWGDDKLGVDSLRKTVKIWDERQKKFLWVGGGILTAISAIPHIIEFIIPYIKP